MPSAYRDFKGILEMRETITKQGYCSPFLEEFERFAEDEETQKFLMHTFLTQIVYETPSIMEEEEWETILRYKNKLGM
jgi:hypothetical protein